MNGKKKYINPDKNYTGASHFKRVEVLKLSCVARIVIVIYFTFSLVLIQESCQDHAHKK